MANREANTSIVQYFCPIRIVKWMLKDAQWKNDFIHDGSVVGIDC